MGRYKLDRRLPNKQDTPVKPTLKRQAKNRRLRPRNRYDALPEEPEVEDHKPTIRQTVPVLHLRSPAIQDNPSCKPASSATPANNKSGYQVSEAGQGTPIPQTDQNRGKESLAVTPESIASSSTDQDTTSSYDDDDDDEDEDEDCYSSASTSSSSIPSPEIFRRETDVETWTLPFHEELLDLHLHIKNSTLLDVSQAQSIRMHNPPNLSTIIDASTILAENNFDISKQSEPETKSFKSDKAFTTPSKVTKRKSILCKKKVWFKSPVIAETFKTNCIPDNKLCTSVVKSEINTPGAREISFKEESLPLKVEIERPVESSPENVKFFDFVDDKDRDAFFQKMRERCVILRSAALFPLTAAVHAKPSVT